MRSAPRIDSPPDSACFIIPSAVLETRYHRLLNHSAVASLLAREGRVFIAADRRPVDDILALHRLGHQHFAVKYAQQTLALTPRLAPVRDTLVLHHYGHVQRNKAGCIIRHCEAIESLDRPELAHRLRHLLDHTPAPRLRQVFIEINVGREPQKTGASPDEADQLLALARDLALPVIGVMAIPPRQADPVPHFRWLRAYADRHGLPEVHMGMSDDFPLAIDHGATAIRIGRWLFGEPVPQPA